MRDLGPWCLELFAGSGIFTAHLRHQGLLLLPPIDVVLSHEVVERQDLLHGDFFERLLLLARMGAIVFLHVGLPCATFSQARQPPGGPRPLRSSSMHLGLPDRSAAEEEQLFAANELLTRSLLLMQAVIASGGDFSLENRLTSLLWQVPAVQQLKVRHHLYNVEFGNTSRKSTRLLVSNALFLQLARTCSGGHEHVPLKGKVRRPDGRWIFATKPAQVYPLGLAIAWSAVVAQIVQGRSFGQLPIPLCAVFFEAGQIMPICSWAPSRTSSSTTSCSRPRGVPTDLSHKVCALVTRSSDPFNDRGAGQNTPSLRILFAFLTLLLLLFMMRTK